MKKENLNKNLRKYPYRGICNQIAKEKNIDTRLISTYLRKKEPNILKRFNDILEERLHEIKRFEDATSIKL